eukprot:365616-Chlamydomonas_euryale.AAC.6
MGHALVTADPNPLHVAVHSSGPVRVAQGFNVPTTRQGSSLEDLDACLEDLVRPSPGRPGRLPGVCQDVFQDVFQDACQDVCQDVCQESIFSGLPTPGWTGHRPPALAEGCSVSIGRRESCIQATEQAPCGPETPCLTGFDPPSLLAEGCSTLMRQRESAQCSLRFRPLVRALVPTPRMRIHTPSRAHTRHTHTTHAYPHPKSLPHQAHPHHACVPTPQVAPTPGTPTQRMCAHTPNRAHTRHTHTR